MSAPYLDAFNRTVAAGGLGTADVGGNYTHPTGKESAFSVASTEAVIVATLLGASNEYRAQLFDVTARDIDATVEFQTDKLAVGGVQSLYIAHRRIDVNNYYRAELLMTTAAAVQVRYNKIVAGSVVTPTGGAATTVSGLTHAINTPIKVRFQAIGANPTILKIKAWLSSNAEPSTWTIGDAGTFTDNEAALQTAGNFYFAPVLSGAATNAPVTYKVRDLGTIDPNAQIARPSSTSAAGGWTAGGGAASLHAAASDQSDTTFMTGTAA